MLPCVLISQGYLQGSCGCLELRLCTHQFVCGWKKARSHSRPPARPRQSGSSSSVAAHCSPRQPYYARTPAVITQHTLRHMHTDEITHNHPNTCPLCFRPQALYNRATAFRE
ncbi:hypothetical protein XENORESO_016332 [Xenotaenia resolanae]|uniref:Uncharacterized protein n=1 Tax=Xenotaenia resolanae TaxID=208358 RepID=A0ABV0WXE2_9TELE